MVPTHTCHASSIRELPQKSGHSTRAVLRIPSAHHVRFLQISNSTAATRLTAEIAHVASPKAGAAKEHTNTVWLLPVLLFLAALSIIPR